MDLLVIRHGIAEDREAFAAGGTDDGLRPLTDDGRRKMRRVARALTTVVPSLDVLASSPLARARQTADLVAKAYSGLPVTEIAQLAPDQPPEAFAEWVRGQSKRGAVAAVGHEPLLGRIVSLLLAGRKQSFVEFRKGGACLVTFSDRVEPGAGILRWILTPGQLRDLRG
jgi:phosphohistidine phosphatase